MTEAAERHNMRLVVITAENETAFAKQNKIISDLLDNNIDALIVAPTNINLTKEFVNAAHLNNQSVKKIFATRQREYFNFELLRRFCLRQRGNEIWH